MWLRVCGLLLLAHGACGGRLGAAGPQLMQQIAEIQERLDKEGDEDQKAHEKLSCWCKTNLEEKKKAVEGMQDELSRLGSDVEAQTAEISRLESELKQHAADISENTESLNQAKVIRAKDSKQFAQDEANHVANLDALDSAMNTIAKGSGIDTALIAVSQVSHRLSLQQLGKQQKEHAEFLQSAGKLNAKSSPDMIYGTLKRMRNAFSEDLDDMRVDEQDAKRRHEDLVSVKAKLVDTLQSQLETKKMRMANAKVQVTQRQSQQDKSQELLQANTQLVSAMTELCDGNDKAFEQRSEERQAETRALAEARSEQANVGLLQGSSKQIDLDNLNPAAEELCVAALGVSEEQWRDRAKAACEKARAGKSQDAADDVSQLQQEIEAASRQAADDKENCKATLQDAKAAADQSARDESVARDSLNSDMSSVSDQISDVTAQASGSDKAKADLGDAEAAVRSVLKAVHTASYNNVNHMQSLKARAAGPASQKIAEAQDHSKKLADAARTYSTALETGAQKVSGLLTETVSAASKVLIPLRMMKADAEQDSLALKEDHEAKRHAASSSVKCDPSALAAKESQLKGYASALGKAAENLAWNALR